MLEKKRVVDKRVLNISSFTRYLLTYWQFFDLGTYLRFYVIGSLNNDSWCANSTYCNFCYALFVNFSTTVSTLPEVAFFRTFLFFHVPFVARF